MNHFNELTPGEHERLACAMEEMGEAIQAIGKVMRHGYRSTNPHDKDSGNNRNQLTRELAHVQYSINRLLDWEDINRNNFNGRVVMKAANIKPWLHHDGEV